MSASFAAVPTTVCTKPEATSTPIWAFIPKCHWLPFRVWCISGSRLFCLFLVEDGAAMIVASTIVPWRINRPYPSSIAPTSSNSPLVKSCRSSQCHALLDLFQDVRLVAELPAVRGRAHWVEMPARAAEPVQSLGRLVASFVGPHDCQRQVCRVKPAIRL